MEKHLNLKYIAKSAQKLITPVVLCVLFVVVNIKVSSFELKRSVQPFQAAPNHEIWHSFTNAIALLGVIMPMSIILLLLYLKRFYKLLKGWLILASFLLLFILNYFYLKTTFEAFNLPMDYPTTLLFIWNFGITGILSIHWHGPLFLQQVYLIFVAALMALAFIKNLAEGTTWFILAAISIWDLLAVLSPKGPLRILVETARKRNESMLPALIYTTTVMEINERNVSACATVAAAAAASNTTTESIALVSLKRRRNGTLIQTSFRKQSVSNENLSHLAVEESSSLPTNAISGVQFQVETQSLFDFHLGIGDFIFYAVLIGRVGIHGNWFTTFACFVALIVGLFLTTLLLTLRRKALPALPIPIAFGSVFYFVAELFVQPFLQNILDDCIFI